MKQCLFSKFLAILFIVSAGCSKNCPDFNSDIVNWMPYKVDDKIVLSDQIDNDTLIVNYSEVYHVSKIGFGKDCACANSFVLNLSSDSLNMDIRFNDSRLIEQSEIVVNDDWMNFSKLLEDTVINVETQLS